MNYLGKNKLYLNALNSDNLSPMIPNFLSSWFTRSDSPNATQRLLSEKRANIDARHASSRNFMANGKSANILYNLCPILVIYLIIGSAVLTKYLVFRLFRLHDS